MGPRKLTSFKFMKDDKVNCSLRLEISLLRRIRLWTLTLFKPYSSFSKLTYFFALFLTFHEVRLR